MLQVLWQGSALRATERRTVLAVGVLQRDLATLKGEQITTMDFDASAVRPRRRERRHSPIPIDKVARVAPVGIGEGRPDFSEGCPHRLLARVPCAADIRACRGFKLTPFGAPADDDAPDASAVAIGTRRCLTQTRGRVLRVECFVRPILQPSNLLEIHMRRLGALLTLATAMNVADAAPPAAPCPPTPAASQTTTVTASTSSAQRSANAGPVSKDRQDAAVVPQVVVPLKRRTPDATNQKAVKEPGKASGQVDDGAARCQAGRL